jgi:hypothetical protein
VWQDTVDHLKRVTDEFARQAQTFDHWAEKADDQVAARFRAALDNSGAPHAEAPEFAFEPEAATPTRIRAA